MTFFVCGAWRNVKLYALDADVQTYCHHAHTQLHTPHCLLVVSGKKYSHLHPKGIALLAVADGFVFIFYSLYHTVSQHSPFSHRLLILIQRELSGLHNRIFSFFSPFFFLFALHIAPCCPTHSHLFPFCTPLHQNCPSWQKGRQGFHRQGWRRARRKSINFTPGAADGSVPPPLLSAPSNLTRTLHRKPVKQSKPICRKLFYFSPPACLKQDLLLMDSPLPTCTVSVVDLAKLRAHAVLYSTLVTKCNSVFFSGSIVDSGRALHHQYAQLPTPYFKSKISPERKWMCWFICLRRPDLKTILISLVGRRGAHGIKMEVVFSCLFI